MQLATRLEEPLHQRACRSTYVVIVGMAGLPLWMSPIFFRTGDAGELIALGLVTSSLAFLWVHSFEVMLTSDSIRYRTLWHGTRVLPLINIERAAVEIGVAETGYPARPMCSLTLYPTTESGQERIDINMKIFGLHEIRKLLEHLGLDKNKTSLIRRRRRQDSGRRESS